MLGRYTSARQHVSKLASDCAADNCCAIKEICAAPNAPTIMGENLNSLFNYVMPRVQRNEAMSVPSVARCRNLLSSVVADLPLNLYRNSTGEELGNPLWVDQPAINQPRSVTMAWTVDSLLMYGVAYWQVTEVYAEDGRPSRFQWIPNVKVTFNTDLYGMTITEYFIDAVAVPMSGLGSIVTFQAFDEGILERGSETIRAAIDLRKAAVIAASTPMPSGVIKNNGADLDPKEIQGLAEDLTLNAQYASVQLRFTDNTEGWVLT